MDAVVCNDIINALLLVPTWLNGKKNTHVPIQVLKIRRQCDTAKRGIIINNIIIMCNMLVIEEIVVSYQPLRCSKLYYHLMGTIRQ